MSTNKELHCFQWENTQMWKAQEIHCHKPIYCDIISVCLSVIFNLNSHNNFIYIHKPNHLSLLNRIILQFQFIKKLQTLQVFLCRIIALCKIVDFFQSVFADCFLVSFCVCTLIYLLHILYCWVVIRFREGVGLDAQRYLCKYNFT